MAISLIADIIGMLGTALVVLAFFLIQLDKLDPKSIQYNLLNLTGAILLLISLCVNFNLASFVIEIFWISASIVGIVKYYSRKQSVSNQTT
ncbi:CBU_0592 family membrane protein [Colwellia sp. MEBiC06753]